MKFHLIIFIIGSSFLMTTPVMAARFYFDPPQIRLAADQTFEVTLRLDAGKDEINAVQGSVIFPADAFQLQETRDGNSIINLWVDRPQQEKHESTKAQKQPGKIIFSGIIPGGFEDHDGLLFTLRFQALKIAVGQVHVQDGQALLNDGKGTAAALEIMPLKYEILAAGSIPAPIIPPLNDTDPPERFMPTVTRDPQLFDGQWALVFATQDKGSGINYYEVTEERPWFRVTGRRVESPYHLTDQWLGSRIYVTAVDKAGNRRTVSLPAQNRWLALVYLLPYILGILLISLIIVWMMLRKKTSRPVR